MKKLVFFAALAVLLFLFFELPNVVKLYIYLAAPVVLLALAYIVERNQK
jgi:hypothetical protein